MSSKQSIICLMGPTAAGKTDAALALAKHLPCEIVSVDSVMVYRGLDIGTAKPSLEERQRVPHHLIDICEVDEPYSAAQFCQDAKRVIDEIITRQRYPILVGGTMLYFRALQQGLAPLPSADHKIRQQLAEEASQEGWQALHARLQRLDPQAAQRIKPQDQQRIQRALEVHALTGKTMTELWQSAEAEPLDYPCINIALAPPERDILHQRIAARFSKMLAAGLVAEVELLYQRGGLSPTLPAIRAVGYRQVWQYLAGELSYNEMEEKAIIATRQFAKRQLTWLRAWPNLQWLDSSDKGLTGKIVALLAK